MRPSTSLISCLLAACLLGSTAEADAAAVTFRSKTCGQGTTTTLTLAKPAGTVTNDVMIASIGTANANAAPTAPSGWVLVPGLSGIVNADQRLATFYKVATASEPANYAFNGGTTIDATAGGITTFDGVDTVDPIAGTPAQSIDSVISTSSTLPNSNGTASGSMRYSVTTMDDAGNQSFQSPMVLGCDEVNSAGTDVATATGWEPTGAGTTATRTVSRTDNGRSILHTLVLMRECGAGGLNLTGPGAVSFPTTQLTGADQRIYSTPSFSVNDQTGNEAGWSLSATSTTFTTGSRTLPTTAAKLLTVNPTAGAGRCAAPTNAVGLPLTIPAAAAAPPAIKLFNAAIGTGMGATNLGMQFALDVPAHARIGNYTSTWTLTVSSGP
ncbi:MAG: WxL domain-containing protein [Solirubrobacteraceae bacterium]|nr:WxL domain-containing protein [Solirubrobacteraceae bacterium]